MVPCSCLPRCHHYWQRLQQERQQNALQVQYLTFHTIYKELSHHPRNLHRAVLSRHSSTLLLPFPPS